MLGELRLGEEIPSTTQGDRQTEEIEEIEEEKVLAKLSCFSRDP